MGETDEEKNGVNPSVEGNSETANIASGASGVAETVPIAGVGADAGASSDSEAAGGDLPSGAGLPGDADHDAGVPSATEVSNVVGVAADAAVDQTSPKRKRLAITIIAAAVVVALAVGGGVAFANRNSKHGADSGRSDVASASASMSASSASASPTRKGLLDAAAPASSSASATPTAEQQDAAQIAKSAFEQRHTWGAEADTDPSQFAGKSGKEMAAAYVMNGSNMYEWESTTRSTVPSKPTLIASDPNSRHGLDETPPNYGSMGCDSERSLCHGDTVWSYYRWVNLITGFHAHASQADCTQGVCTVSGTVNYILWSNDEYTQDRVEEDRITAPDGTVWAGAQSQSAKTAGEQVVWNFAPIWGTFPLTETWTVNADGSVASTDTSLCSDAWSADPWYCAAGQSGPNTLHWLKQNSTAQRHESMPLTGTPPDGAHMSARATAYTVDQTLVASGSGAQPYDSDMWFGWSFAGR